MQILGFFVLCVIWGTTWLAIKISLEGLPPFLGAGIRFCVALTALFFFVRNKRMSRGIRRADFFLLTVSAILLYGFNYGLIYWGEQYINAGVAAIFFATFVLFTCIWTNFLFRSETFRWKTFVGLVIGFCGIVIVFYDQLERTHFSRMVLLASAAVILSAACGAMSLVIVKKYLSKMDPYALTFYQMGIGVFLLLLTGFLLEHPGDIRINVRVGLSVLYLGIVGSAFAFVIYYRLLQEMSAITLSLIIYITPLFALVADYVTFHEQIPFRSFAGMVVIFLGAGLTQKKTIKIVSIPIRRNKRPTADLSP